MSRQWFRVVRENIPFLISFTAPRTFGIAGVLAEVWRGNLKMLVSEAASSR